MKAKKYTSFGTPDLTAPSTPRPSVVPCGQSPGSKQLRVPDSLITWIEEQLNTKQYGRCVIEFVIHQGNVRIKRAFEESAELSEYFGDK